ncbi:hypothetical protein L083_5595 [Actinoplanes sp. N902-109]|nr:hypothetical protein L083_5595 [Actinoplanes sp. N902-109]
MRWSGRDLAVRDELARARVPAVVAEAFERARDAVDAIFLGRTREVRAESGRGWWWGRVPDPEPWPSRD